MRARIYDNVQKKMSAPIDLDLFMHGDEELQFPETNETLPFSDFLVYRSDFGEWMLAIGVTDKNGKEICKGDIIVTKEHSDLPFSKRRKIKRHIGEVVYIESQTTGEAGWGVSIKDEGAYGCSNWGDFFDCAVTGNIYQHPDLL